MCVCVEGKGGGGGREWVQICGFVCVWPHVMCVYVPGKQF